MTSTVCTGSFCEDIGAAIQTMDTIQLTKMLNLASLALYIYDYGITFDREVTTMWSAGMGIGKLLFLAARYCTLIDMLIRIDAFSVMFLPKISIDVSNCWVKSQWIIGIIMCTITEMTLQLRIYAMYNKSRKILLLFTTTLIITVVADVVIAAMVVKKEKPVILNFGSDPSMRACWPADSPSFFWAYWTPALANESLLFGLALYKGIQNLRVFGTESSMSRLLTLLVRDSVLYFFVVFSFFFMAQIIWIVKGQTYMEVPSGFAMAIEAIMIQRLLLNLREDGSDSGQQSYGSFSTQQLVFTSVQTY
ncbi:hypothetical protein DFH11DRAFT_1223714 [Phellopilus nigrolimitatus]|nr:hypothetical protein DFH11DRAFT_1223714 [Phellopilus nigrolimitatus]